MSEIGNTRLLFFDRNFALEVPRHSGKFGDHSFELGDPPLHFVDLKAPHARKRFPRRHLFISVTRRFSDVSFGKSAELVNKYLLPAIGAISCRVAKANRSGTTRRT